VICTLCKQHTEDASLCPGCTRATLERLQRLPRMWASLDAWLAPGSTGSANYGGRVRLAEAPLPLNQEVLDLRSAGGIVGVLEDWHDAVRETRELAHTPRIGALAHRVNTAAAGLSSHIHFIALWDQGGDFAREIERLVDRVRAVVIPGRDPDEPTLLGYCIAVDPSGIICGNRLYADMGRPVQCAWCLCQYPPDTWLALRHYQPGAPNPDDTRDADAVEDTATAA